MVGVGGTNMAGAGAPIGPGASGWLGRTPTSRRGGAGGVSEVDEPALDRRMVLLPSRNSISSTCALTCPFVVAQSRGSHDFSKGPRALSFPPVLLTCHHSPQPFRCPIAFCARAMLRHPVGWAGLARRRSAAVQHLRGLRLGLRRRRARGEDPRQGQRYPRRDNRGRGIDRSGSGDG